MNSPQSNKKDTYLASVWLEITRENDKLIGVSTKPGETFRAFAYINGPIDAAETSILMEYRDKQLSGIEVNS